MSRLNVFILLLLVLLSITIHRMISPYETDGPQRLANADFKDGSQSWQVYGKGLVEHVGGTVILVNLSREKSFALTQQVAVEENSDYIISVNASAVGIKPDSDGRLVVVSMRGEDRIPDFDIPSDVFRLTGTSFPQNYRMYVHTYPGVSALTVQVQLPDSSGRLTINELSLTSAIEISYWSAVQAIMLSLFFLYLTWLFTPLFRLGSLDWVTAAGLFVVALIILFTTMPLSLKNEIYHIFREVAPTLNKFLSLSAMQGDAGVTNNPEILAGRDSRFFSVMHFLFFMTATILLFTGRSGFTSIQKFFSLIAVAVATETMQLFVMNRHGAVDNVLVDVAGVLLGIAVYKGLSGRKGGSSLEY